MEADDLIGMAAIMHRAFSLPVVVYSSDKDFMQLMSVGVTVIKPVPFSILVRGVTSLEPETKASVMKRYGCLPEDILKVRAYAGDTSDAIPVAIPLIGEKRALKCLAAGADPSKDVMVCRDLKLYGKLLAGWANVRRNYRLMQIAAFPDPAVFGAETVEHVRAELKRVATMLKAPVPDAEIMETSYWHFVRTLIAHDLWEAVENRFTLWQIQRPVENYPLRRR